MKKTFLYTVFPVLLALFGIGSVVGNPFVVDDRTKKPAASVVLGIVRLSTTSNSAN